MVKKLISASLALSFMAMLAAPVAMAENENKGRFWNLTSTSPTAEQITCIKNAIDKRDTAIITGVDAYSTAVKNALSARKDALKAAWDKPDKKERQAALKAAWKTYKDTVKNARKDLKTARQSAWKTFGTERKVCKVSESEQGGGEGADSGL